MRITNEDLIQIIKEELEAVIDEKKGKKRKAAKKKRRKKKKAKKPRLKEMLVITRCDLGMMYGRLPMLLVLLLSAATLVLKTGVIQRKKV
jgi:hypothetical protein